MNPLVNTISNRLSLRQPQRDSLEILAGVCEIARPDKGTDAAKGGHQGPIQDNGRF